MSGRRCVAPQRNDLLRGVCRFPLTLRLIGRRLEVQSHMRKQGSAPYWLFPNGVYLVEKKKKD